jgi:hypothetical protein
MAEQPPTHPILEVDFVIRVIHVSDREKAVTVQPNDIASLHELLE